MFEIFKAAGWPIWFLLFASIISMALIFERIYSLRRDKILPPGLLQQTLSQFQIGQDNSSYLMTLERQSPLGQVLSAGLRHATHSREVMLSSLEEAGCRVSHELSRYLTTIGTIAAVAPLMGLFGTVVGMIEIFGSQSANGVGADPVQLAHGISVALYNTGFGILIAIPSLIFWRYFRHNVDGFVVEMQHQAMRLVEYIHDRMQ